MPSEQNCTRSTLPTAKETQQQVALRLWISTLASMCLLVQSAEPVPVGSSIFRQHAGCTVRSPPPLPPNHTATWCPCRPVFHKSHGRTITFRLLRFPSNCSHGTFVVTFCMRASHADVHPELLLDSQEPGEWVPLRCCFSPSRRAQGHGAPCPRSPVLAQKACARCAGLRGAVWPCPPPVVAAKRVERVRRQRLLAHAPIIAFPQSTRAARACIRRCTEP